MFFCIFWIQDQAISQPSHVIRGGLVTEVAPKNNRCNMWWWKDTCIYDFVSICIESEPFVWCFDATFQAFFFSLEIQTLRWRPRHWKDQWDVDAHQILSPRPASFNDHDGHSGAQSGRLSANMALRLSPKNGDVQNDMIGTGPWPPRILFMIFNGDSTTHIGVPNKASLSHSKCNGIIPPAWTLFIFIIASGCCILGPLNLQIN